MTTTGSAPPAPARTAGRGRRRRWAVVAAAVAVGLVAVLLVAVLRARDGDPLSSRPLYTWPGSAAASAAGGAGGADREVLQRLADVPTAIWLTPEAQPPGQVGDFVAGLVAAADEADDATPLLVVYGITDRDCATGESAGGLSADQYTSWVDEIAGALDDDAAVVLEPDALATLDQCADPARRLDLLGRAVASLDSSGTTTYVDAGHSDWVDPATMADRLDAVGVDRVRGFATNVANYQTSDDERAYADAIVEDLDAQGDGEAHYVIDTGRNGEGSTADWCNPPGRALGAEPDVEGDGALDATLWIKPPGESDGSCHGGPPAGQFWPTQALALARAAGW